MATKRELKKYIQNMCGALASEIVLARAAFPQIERKAVHDIVVDVARLQAETLAKTGISFDKAPRDYANRADYNKARRTYFNTAYNKLMDDFDAAVAKVIKKMNEALPDDVRATIKTAAK